MSTFSIQPVKASGTIYIRANGSVDPPTANVTSFDNVTYTFTSNIYDQIAVERSNIIIDGNGHTLQGTGSGTGIDLSERQNVTIRDTNIGVFEYGIKLYHSSRNEVYANNINNNGDYAIYLDNSDNNLISGNNMTGNGFSGICFSGSNHNIVCGSNIENDNYGVWINGCYNNTICNNRMTHNEYAIRLTPSANGNTISGNIITDNVGGVVFGWYSTNNKVFGNHISKNSRRAIGLTEYAYNNNISANHLIDNGWDGILLYESPNNMIWGNTIMANGRYGIQFVESSGNTVYNNNLANNTNQIDLDNLSISTWDNGYEGNYWSDYEGTDSNNDGIGDSPYIIDGNTTDNYPLMKPYIWWNPADINYDMKVDIFDVVLVCSAYGSILSDPNWNCHCDIAEPFGIIDIYDVVMICMSYGEEYNP